MRNYCRLRYNESQLYLNIEQKEWLIKKYNHGLEKREHIDYRSYEDAVILPPIVRVDNNTKKEHRYGGVVDKNGDYVIESKPDSTFEGGYEPSEIVSSDMTVVYCGWDLLQWGHFLVNVLPRLWISLCDEVIVDKFIIIRDVDSPIMLCDNEKEILRILGILDKIWIVRKPMRFMKVIVPELSYYGFGFGENNPEKSGYFHDSFIDLIDTIKSRILKEQKQFTNATPQLIFYSRKRENVSIEKAFLSSGYSVVYPEDISMAELICQLQQAKRIVVYSGSAQHNLLFAPNGAKVVELDRRMRINGYQADIDIIKQFDVTYCNVQYMLFPTRPSNSTILYKSKYLKRFMSDNEMLLTADCDDEKDELCEALKVYLGRITKFEIEPYFDRISWNALEKSVLELSSLFDEIGSISNKEYRNNSFWNDYLENLLYAFEIPYIDWDEKNVEKLRITISKIIDRAIREGFSEFLVYPYGRNGMIAKGVLKEKYSIEPIGVFDNELYKYSPDVKKLSEITSALGEKTCVLLTSHVLNCKQNLEQFVKKDIVFGWFSVV